MAMGWGQVEAGLRPSASAAAAGQGPVSLEKTKTNQRRAGPSTQHKVQSRLFIEIKDRGEWQFSSLTKCHSDKVDICLGIGVKRTTKRKWRWKS